MDIDFEDEEREEEEEEEEGIGVASTLIVGRKRRKEKKDCGMLSFISSPFLDILRVGKIGRYVGGGGVSVLSYCEVSKFWLCVCVCVCFLLCVYWNSLE